MENKHYIFLFILLFYTNIFLQAQSVNRNWSIEGNAYFGSIMKPDKLVEHCIDKGTSRIYNIELGYKDVNSPSSSSFNYPHIGLGLSMVDFSDVRMVRPPHSLGNIYAFYAFFDRTVFRYKNLSLSYKFESGLAYNTDVYDAENNANKIFSGSAVMVYIGLGIGARYSVSDNIEIGTNFQLKHYSNGRIAMQNKGLNLKGGNISIRYLFSPEKQIQPRIASSGFGRYFNYHLSVGGGLQTCLEELFINQEKNGKAKTNYSLYPKYFLSFDASYFWIKKYSCGLGIDFFYIPQKKSFREYDRLFYDAPKIQKLKYLSLSVGLSFNQEVHYNNLSLYSSLGYYLYRELGLRFDEKKFYQKAGFRYYFPKFHDLFAGAGIKAHEFSKAEYIEFAFGKRF